MSKTMKLVILIVLIAGGAFGLARILNVDTSFLTGDLLNRNIKMKSLKQTGQILVPTGVVEKSQVTKELAQIKPLKKDIVKNISSQIQIPDNSKKRQMQESAKLEKLAKLKQRQVSREQARTNIYIRDQLAESINRRARVQDINTEELLDNRLIYQYVFFRPPLLESDSSVNNGTTPPDLCLPNVAKEKLSSQYFEINDGLYLNVGGCEPGEVEIEFSHRFSKLDTEGKVLRFADADASKSYKITYLGNDKYKVQYLTGDEAWEQTQIVNPLNEKVIVESLSPYGSKYRVGLFELNGELVVISFKIQ